jgi:hypothetical protein
MMDDVRFAIRRIIAACAYESACAVFRKGSSAVNEPWFTSMTQWPAARRPISLTFGRTRADTAVARAGPAADNTAGFESAITRQ